MTKLYRYPSVLSIAGFDGSGGAGIQADIKNISALGCYATTVLTALPVQNTQGVRNILPIPERIVEEQLYAILDDIPPDAIKIGMVHTPTLVYTLSGVLKQYPGIPIIFDPVMIASSGDALITRETIETIKEQLFPMSEVITPNMDEAMALTGRSIHTTEDMYGAMPALAELGAATVLLKGGHLKSDILTSLFIDREGEIHTFRSPRFDTPNTHGSGCTLSSAIASFRALGMDLLPALEQAQQYVQEAIKNALDVQTGKGHGPLNHLFAPRPMALFER